MDLALELVGAGPKLILLLIHLSNKLVLHVKKLLTPSLARLDGLVNSSQADSNA